jgi:hypothetical protein
MFMHTIPFTTMSSIGSLVCYSCTQGLARVYYMQVGEPTGYHTKLAIFFDIIIEECQYLLMPNKRNPCSMGSLGTTPSNKAKILITVCTVLNAV